MKKNLNIMGLIGIIVLPVLYCLLYTAVKQGFCNMGENFANPVDMRILFAVCGLVSAMFILVMLAVTKIFAVHSYSKRVIAVVIVFAHLLISYILPGVINYYHYAEMVGSMITVIVLILFEKVYRTDSL